MSTESQFYQFTVMITVRNSNKNSKTAFVMTGIALKYVFLCSGCNSMKCIEVSMT